MEQEKIGVCVVVLDKDKNKILLGKRLNGYKIGFYGLPGGRLILTEKLIDCAKRELIEETELSSDSLGYLGVIRELQEGYNFIHFAYLCTAYSSIPKNTEPDKCEGWEWFSFDEIPEKILPGHKAAIDLFLNSDLPSIRDIFSVE